MQKVLRLKAISKEISVPHSSIECVYIEARFEAEGRRESLSSER